MKKIIFVYDHEYPHLWKDGLWAALKLLEKEYDITYFNLREGSKKEDAYVFDDKDFILGWGGFNSSVDDLIRGMPTPKGLCIGGNAYPPIHADDYNVIFYETDWYEQFITDHPNKHKAFGVNSDIYFPSKQTPLFDVISVGAFSTWKRQHLMKKYDGIRLCIGQIQRNNIEESMGIILPLLADGVMISDMVSPEKLSALYRASKLCYIPAEINGGGERAILEARMCGIPVEIEDDNEKLKTLITGPIPDHHTYAKQLKKGIKSVL